MKVATTLANILFVVTLYAIPGFTLHKFILFERVGDLEDKICPESEQIFTNKFGYGKLGIGLCSSTCSVSPNCSSVFYNSVTSLCTGCREIYNLSSPLNNSTGTSYLVKKSKAYMETCFAGDICVEPHQECFTDRCICSPGYSYNPSNSTCVTECETYGTTFQEYPNRRIHVDNLYTIRNLTLAQCLEECRSNTACLSLDYGTVPGETYCNIQSVTVLTTSRQFEVIDTYTFYARDCA